ncbi:MAG TPA: reverse transcriptase domain-containing protein [Acidobacteriaceae bacterium]
MRKAPISLQDLRRSLYVKAKAEPLWRFWGLYVHVCKKETLWEAYQMARSNNGAPGIDGVTFQAIEEGGVEGFLGQIRTELVTNTYRPMPARKKGIPKDGGKKLRILSIPAIRDRVVQGALKLILEPIFEADFQAGSYGYRPKRTAHEAVARVARAIVEEKTRIVDLDLTAYFDNVQHSLLLEKVARRVHDDAVMHLLKMMLKATGKKGVPQGGVVTPRTQKVISSSSEQLRDGEPSTLCLIFALRGNTVMSYGALDQNGEGSTAERRSWSAPASSCASRSSTAVVTRVRFVRAPSISLSRRSLSSRSTSRSSRSHCTGHVEASTADGGPAPEVRQKQRPEHRSDRNRRVECVSAYSKKAWLSRVEKAAHFKSTSLIRLIACSSPSSRWLTTFWCHVASAPSACA